MTDMPPAAPTQPEIEAYYRNATIGAAAVVRRTHGGFLQLTLTNIEGRNPSLGRVYIRGFGAFYLKHGKNCYHPKGQTTLALPDEQTLAWIRTHGTNLFNMFAEPSSRKEKGA